MKAMLALLAVALLGAGATSCVGAGHSASPVKTPTSVAASGSLPLTTSSAAARPTGIGASASSSLPGQREGQSEGDPRPYESFGHKAGRALTQAIAPVVIRYFAMVAAGDGGKACSLLYSTLAESVPEDYGKSPPGPPELHGKTCAAVMSRLFKHRHGQPTADVATIQVTSVRIKGNKGIALLRSRTMGLGEIAVYREGSSWKMWQLLGFALSY